MSSFSPGTTVEYYSASLKQWILARVLGPGRQGGTLDLDCKEGVETSRVRLPTGSLVPPSSVGSIMSSTGSMNNFGGYPGTGAGAALPRTGGLGPWKVRAGESVFYLSSSHGWILARVSKFRVDELTYDLDVKQQVPPDKISPIHEGTIVEYHSASTDQWIRARVLAQGQSPDTFDLDCKAGVPITRLRHADSGAAPMNSSQSVASYGSYGSLPPQTSTPSPRAHALPAQPPRAMGALGGPERKLEQLRNAMRAEDSTKLRQRIESKSALGLVGEELDQANHMLWVMEARPEALKDLRRAMSRFSIDELQAALEAAAVVGVDEEDLEAGCRRLRELKAQMWRYDAGDRRHLDLRSQPDIDGPRTKTTKGKGPETRLNPGDIFRVSEEREGRDGVLFLRLADGRGWAFDKKPGLGAMCFRLFGNELQKTSAKVPITHTIANLRSMHDASMKAKAPKIQPMDAILEETEDSPGPYIITDTAAVTPTADLCSEREIIEKLSVGEAVTVLEVRHRADVKRVRGRIKRPPGWISIADTESGRRWAERQAY
mmetsp:Transcript_7041/g.13064  ORF Transcript_7041/g.13064 Transcript_7041/m.13064 type:complete len:545 (+) Transcript_7041:71-1705(+)